MQARVSAELKALTISSLLLRVTRYPGCFWPGSGYTGCVTLYLLLPALSLSNYDSSFICDQLEVEKRF